MADAGRGVKPQRGQRARRADGRPPARASGEVEPVSLRRRRRGGQGGPLGGETKVGEDLRDGRREVDVLKPRIVSYH